MKTRLVSLNYRGTASVDPRYSAAMLPWTINDIRSMENYTRLSVGIENGILESYNADFELQFSHPLRHIVGMCRIVHKPGGKSAGNGFMQIKQSNASHTHHAPTGRASALTTSTSYGSLSASAAAHYQQLQQQQQQQQQHRHHHQHHASSDASDREGNNNFMEFTGPLTGLVYLMKEPRDPLLHIYLFECETLNEMAELMHQMRDPAHTLGGSVGSIPQTLVASSSRSGSELSMQKALANNGNGIHSTPATNLKLTEAVRNAQHDASPNLISSKMKSSKSYTHGLSNSAGTVNIPTSTSAQGNLALLADISPNHTHFFEVMYVGKIRVSHKRVPFTFIDDALPKFKAYDAQRLRLLQMTANRKSDFKNNGSLTEHEEGEKDDTEQDDEQEQQDDEDGKSEGKSDTQDEATTEESQAPENEQPKEHLALSAEETEADNQKDKKLPRPLLRGLSQSDMILEKKDGKSDATGSEMEPGTAEGQMANANKTPSPSPPFPRQDVQQKPHQQQQQQQQAQPAEARLIAPKEYAKLPQEVHVQQASQQKQQPLDIIPKQRDRSASYGCIPPYVEQNRTMVFLVGRSDLRLISPDRKQVLLYKDFKDVASCAQGQKNADHFGIICREAHNEGYIGYVFKCQSDHVCDDIVAAISQAFVTCAEQKKKEATQIFSCEHCPMLWYHKLCTDVENLSEKKTQSMIFRRIEQLSDDEQDMIWAKFYGSEKMTAPLSEQNQFLMMLLRAHCESRQQRHVHDTAENRSEFLNQYLGGSTIFMKAKRSLTNSFDHLLKRKASKDEIIIPASIREHQPRENSSEPQQIAAKSSLGNESPPEDNRARANNLGTSPSKPTAEQLKSPMMDIFIKVGNSPKEAETHQGSWRQAILNSVVTPSKGMENSNQTEFLSPMRITKPKQGKRTREDLRELWKTAIRQTILLNRMETENAMLQARQNENELKRIKLDYEEIMPCDKQLIERWEMIIERDSVKIGNKKDPKVLAGAIKTGVPRSKRGDVWTFLAEQHSMNTAPVDTKKFPNFKTPYQMLLKNLTEHQHAIFIDLGRTFPNHKFYKDPLGVGQLSLFNLLKAYSILDPELGYCQGLGFICGILLLHCDEADAFELLKHLMFRRQMRTKYLPDMKKFQLQLYQLSRLVKDHLPDLYVWLDQNDVSPTLYAAPWILTVFSSQFPLGFVARVFDLLFLESSEVIFKFAIALLSVHKDELLKRDNFEEIMDYLKTIVPKLDAPLMDKVMRMVFSLDISKQLTEYNVEYNVLQEEISTTNHHLDMLNREKAHNQHLEEQLQFAQSSIAQLEQTRVAQQSQIAQLQTQLQSFEVTIQALGRFVAQLSERDTSLELPGDVRRILQQLDELERQRRKPNFSDRKIGKSVSVNSHLGFHLRVLEELNEKEEPGSPQNKKKEKTPFFEHTYEQLRQQQQHRNHASLSVSLVGPPRSLLDDREDDDSDEKSPTMMRRDNQRPSMPQQRPNCLINTGPTAMEMQAHLDELKLPDYVEKFVSNIKSPMEVDSGVGTPLSPPSTSSTYSNSSGHNSGSSNSTASSSMERSLSIASCSSAGLTSGIGGAGGGGLFSRMGYKNPPTTLANLTGNRTSLNSSSNTNSNNYNNNTSITNVTASKPSIAPTISVKEVINGGDTSNMAEMHPLGMVGDVHVCFNGTTQLKSIRPVHHIRNPKVTNTVSVDAGAGENSS